MGSLLYLMPGSVLLSHGETPHYHRRYGVSLLSSAWIQVGPPRYGRQANSVSFQPLHSRVAIETNLGTFAENLEYSYHPDTHPFGAADYGVQNRSRRFCLKSPKHLWCCKVKPHGSLVLVSSMHRCTYTPSLSTSSSLTFLQGA